MQRPIFKPVGTPVAELDTPALIVDLDVLERNVGTVHSYFERSSSKLRPHVESHVCPAIAHRQLAAGGTVGGIAVTTVGQAEVFAGAGFNSVFVTGMVVTPQKIARLCALSRSATMIVAVDNHGNVLDLSDAAASAGVELDVMVQVDAGFGWLGVPPGEPAVELATAVNAAPGLRLAGLATQVDAGDAAGAPESAVGRVLVTRESLQQKGNAIGVVSVVTTYGYDTVAEIDGVTEVVCGSYALMDLRGQAQRAELRSAARVAGSVTSLPEPGVIITDTGRKAIANDTGEPALTNVPGGTLRSLSAEHGTIDLDETSDTQLELGDTVLYNPWDIGACVNLYDYIYGVRDDRLELVWEVTARGRYR